MTRGQIFFLTVLCCLIVSKVYVDHVPATVYYHARSSDWAILVIIGCSLLLAIAMATLPTLVGEGAAIIAGTGFAQVLAWAYWDSRVPDYYVIGDRIYDLADLVFIVGCIVVTIGVFRLLGRAQHRV